MMKRMIKKILAYTLSGPLFHLIPSRKIKTVSTEVAEQIVARHSPDLGRSALCNHVWSKPEYDLTIIIPVYNAEKYLVKCLDSILNQKTDYSFQLVLINDGSTDKTEAILHSYQDDSRVFVIHQNNGGAAKARNAGLQNVLGRYVMFIDSDDFLPENAVDSLLSAAYETDADIVQGRYSYADATGKVYADGKQHQWCVDVASNGVLEGYVCGKIYHANLFRIVYFPEGYWYEDTIITALITHMAKRIVTIPEIGYFYRQHSLSITRIGKGKPKSMDAFWVQRCVLRDRKKLGFVTDQSFYEHLLRMVALCYRRTVDEPENVKIALMILWKDLLTQERSEKFQLGPLYSNFEKAIFESNYNQYCVLCRFCY
jgi:glycosyltransferase involved in cell wall biosynthesis